MSDQSELAKEQKPYENKVDHDAARRLEEIAQARAHIRKIRRILDERAGYRLSQC